MKIHSLNHADFENLGYFQTWAEKHGHSMTITHTHKGDILPSTNDYDFLLIMGWPQTALQLEKFPFYYFFAIVTCITVIQVTIKYRYRILSF